MKNIDYGNGAAEQVTKSAGELGMLWFSNANLVFFDPKALTYLNVDMLPVTMEESISIMGTGLCRSGREILKQPAQITPGDAEIFGLEVDILLRAAARSQRMIDDKWAVAVKRDEIADLHNIQMRLLGMLREVSKDICMVCGAKMTEEEYRGAKQQEKKQEKEELKESEQDKEKEELMQLEQEKEKEELIKSEQKQQKKEGDGKGSVVDDQAIAILGKLPSDLPAKPEKDGVLRDWRDPYKDYLRPTCKDLLALGAKQLCQYADILTKRWAVVLGEKLGQRLESYIELQKDLVRWDVFVAQQSKRWNVDLESVEKMTCKEQMEYFGKLVEERLARPRPKSESSRREEEIYKIDRGVCYQYESLVKDMAKCSTVDFGQSMKSLHNMVERKIDQTIQPHLGL